MATHTKSKTRSKATPATAAVSPAATAAAASPATKTAKPAPTRAAARPAVKQPVGKSANAAKAVKTANTAKSVKSVKAVPAPKPAKPARIEKPAKVDKPLKPVKAKLVRDSFTMPQADFDLVAVLKTRALGFQRATKKSELLRAGLHALQALDDAALGRALDALVPLKPGRPRNPD